MPADLMIAIEHAHRILDWQENLTKDEIPPQWMWHLDKELESHWEMVEEKRKDKSGGSGSSSDDEGSSGLQNDLTRGMR